MLQSLLIASFASPSEGQLGQQVTTLHVKLIFWSRPQLIKVTSGLQEFAAFALKQLWLRAISVNLLIENWNCLNLVLHRVARQFCKSHFSKLKSKLREINPSLHSIKRLKVVAEATALASPAPVHRGRTPYDLAKEFGHQQVMGLLHPVPRRKAVEEPVSLVTECVRFLRGEFWIGDTCELFQT